MGVSAFVSPSPKFTTAAPSGVASVRARLARLASELAVELGRPAAELAAQRLTVEGAAHLRRAAAQRALPSLEAERASLDRLEGERIAAHESQLRAAADAEARLSPSVLARAAQTARLFDAGGAGDKGARERFVQAVDAGELDAVYGALMLSPFGPLATVAERGRERFLASVVPPSKRDELRALTVALAVVRGEFDALHDAVAAIAKTGLEKPDTAASLLARANDEDRTAAIEEGRRLGVFEPAAVSVGAASPQRDRLVAVGEGAASNRGSAATGGRQ
jgi:hypothetical protein